MATRIPDIGDLHTFVSYPGYKLYQNRPFKCRDAGRCVCGSGCYGTYTAVTQAVASVECYASGGVVVVGASGLRAEIIPDSL